MPGNVRMAGRARLAWATVATSNIPDAMPYDMRTLDGERRRGRAGFASRSVVGYADQQPSLMDTATAETRGSST
jgi:hypothetical protein